MNLTDPWEQLEKEQGVAGRARRRIHPDSDRDLFLELDLATRRRMLTFSRPLPDDVEVPQLASSRALECVVSLRESEHGAVLSLTVVLDDPALKEVFVRVVDDLVDTTISAPDDDAALSGLIHRIVSWQELFHGLRRDGLPDSERRGLVGELLVLRDVIMPALGASRAVAAWTGPLRANQDFQAPSWAVEVKTTVSLHPQGMTVNNERELEAPDDASLILAHLSLDERRGAGATLPEIVADVRRLLSVDPPTSAPFEQLLARAGYLDEQSNLYDEPHYSLRKLRFFDICDGFPRIRECELIDGVGQVSYRVSLAACSHFEMSDSEAVNRLKGKS